MSDSTVREEQPTVKIFPSDDSASDDDADEEIDAQVWHYKIGEFSEFYDAYKLESASAENADFRYEVSTWAGWIHKGTEGNFKDDDNKAETITHTLGIIGGAYALKYDVRNEKEEFTGIEFFTSGNGIENRSGLEVIAYDGDDRVDDTYPYYTEENFEQSINMTGTQDEIVSLDSTFVDTMNNPKDVTASGYITDTWNGDGDKEGARPAAQKFINEESTDYSRISAFEMAGMAAAVAGMGTAVSSTGGGAAATASSLLSFGWNAATLMDLMDQPKVTDANENKEDGPEYAENSDGSRNWVDSEKGQDTYYITTPAKSDESILLQYQEVTVELPAGETGYIDVLHDFPIHSDISCKEYTLTSSPTYGSATQVKEKTVTANSEYNYTIKFPSNPAEGPYDNIPELEEYYGENCPDYPNEYPNTPSIAKEYVKNNEI